jgi:hypothetical protein
MAMNIGNRGGVAAMVGVGLLLSAGPAGARESWRHVLARADNPVCSAAYTHALERVQEAHLKEARELFAQCARATCSELTRRECAARHAQLDADIPSVVPLVTDDEGEPHILVEVRVDGVLATSRLDGRALSVDPGKHELSFSTDDGVFATRRLMVVQGERNRPIHVALHAADEAGLKRARDLVPAGSRRTEARGTGAPPSGTSPGESEEKKAPEEDAEPAASRKLGLALDDAPDVTTKHATAREGSSPAAYVFGALGLVGVGGFGFLTYWGRADNNMLSTCSPTCTDGSVRHVRELYWAADASLGVGIASLAISTWLFASSGPAEKSTQAAGPLSLDLRPTRAGGVATIAGRF